MPHKPTVAERFWSKVDVRGPDDCWLWTSALAGGGYGKFWRDGKYAQAHRWAYEQANGPIPEGLTLDHLCRTRSCVNARHLEAVTNRENILRGDTIAAANARKTHCKRGHEFTPENTYTARGWRECRPCARDRKQERRSPQPSRL